ncbi:MAG: hypoxanthine phosphoribosyltransferase [Flavobacteriaceae bacterium]|jgi:hypoxanthine phosphoribosyltransferase|nr:hypoxanthine phosphoribosyltransferase [Flavobacteriaceae bacterium]
MEEIKIHDKTFIPFITYEEIDKAVQRIANTLYEEYKEEVPVFVGVLNGVIMFYCDLLKHYNGECEVAFLQLASYHGGLKNCEKIDLVRDVNKDLTNRHVIILEDIVDTGNTIEFLHKLLENKPVKSIKIVSLFFKPEMFKKDLNVDLTGINLPNKFVVGYGLDYAGLGRNLKDLYMLKEN